MYVEVIANLDKNCNYKNFDAVLNGGTQRISAKTYEKLREKVESKFDITLPVSRTNLRWLEKFPTGTGSIVHYEYCIY